jgi:hypothetical protein
LQGIKGDAKSEIDTNAKKTVENTKNKEKSEADLSMKKSDVGVCLSFSSFRAPPPSSIPVINVFKVFFLLKAVVLLFFLCTTLSCHYEESC